MFGITQHSGGAHLQGIHIPCAGRGSVFLEPADGLNVLYGKNGSGKSTILEGLKLLSRGLATDSLWGAAGATAVFSIDPSLVEAIFDDMALGWTSADPSACSIPPGHNRLTAEHPIKFWLDNFGTVSPPSLDAIAQRLELDPWLGGGVLLDDDESSEDDENMPVDQGRFNAAVASIAQHWMLREKVNPNEEMFVRWPLWYLTHLRATLASDLEAPKVPDDPGVPAVSLGSTEEMRSFLTALDIKPPDVNLDTNEPGDLASELWETLVSLLLFREASLTSDDRLESWQSDDLAAQSVAPLARELMSSRLIAITACGTPDSPRWRVDLAADLREEDSSLARLIRERQKSRGSDEHDETPDERAWQKRISHLFGFIEDGHESQADLWHQLGQVYESLSADERASIDELSGGQLQFKMLCIFADAAGLEDEERRSFIHEKRTEILETEDASLAVDSDIGAEDQIVSESDDDMEVDEESGSRASREIKNFVDLLVGRVIGDGRYCVSRIGFSTTRFPWAFCDLDETPDPEQRLLGSFRRSLMRGPLAVGSFVEYTDRYEERGDHNLESEAVRRLQESVHRSGERISMLGIGVGGLRLRVSADIRDWLDPGPVALEALDAPSQRWVNVRSLSQAQFDWVSRILHLEHEMVGGFPLLVTADEPESGVHVTASHAILHMFERLGVTSIIASHAPTAFRLHETNLILVDRDFSGSVVLGTPGTSEDVRSAAARLGTTPLDVLSMRRLLVYVEGSHDEAVIRSLLAHSQEENLEDRVIIAPARGVRQFGGVATSVILTEFTDLHVLVIADNAQTEALRRLRDEAAQLLGDGFDPPVVKRRLRLHEQVRESPEERVLWDLLERCIDRYLVHRIDFYGLAVPDIIDLLPPTSFGLDMSWSDLRAEHAARRGSDFKSWLREVKSANISVRSIRAAVANMDELSVGLLGILSAIEDAKRRAVSVLD